MGIAFSLCGVVIYGGVHFHFIKRPRFHSFRLPFLPTARVIGASRSLRLMSRTARRSGDTYEHVESSSLSNFSLPPSPFFSSFCSSLSPSAVVYDCLIVFFATAPTIGEMQTWHDPHPFNQGVQSDKGRRKRVGSRERARKIEGIVRWIQRRPCPFLSARVFFSSCFTRS